MPKEIMNSSFSPFREKMQSADLSEAAIAAFERAFRLLASKESGLIPESSINPVEQLPNYEEISSGPADGGLLAKAVMLKLNGGLGTGMGLEKAKSLLVVRNGETFSTSKDTRAHLARYPELGAPGDLELMQNKVPKIAVDTLMPAEWPADPELEWCPPGHGDLYPAILGSGMLDRLLKEGYLYLFVSNSDNLGATMDPALLNWFAGSDMPFLMEVTTRTAADRKGGHLAKRASDGQLLLRESAQCSEEDMDAFQDISRHRYFNTNNLWLRLDHLAEGLRRNGGLLPLPVITNQKTIDPRNKKSPAVYQLETAMGAAIECFSGAGAVVVPRTRFAPVKTTSDLLALRSDAYVITEDGRAMLAPERDGIPPEIDLDGDHFKLMDQLEAALAGGVPSLLHCRRLTVRGPVRFSSSDRFEGDVVLEA
jgi:UTP--glucose-1-phosphate uridylyltransferase